MSIYKVTRVQFFHQYSISNQNFNYQLIPKGGNQMIYKEIYNL